MECAKFHLYIHAQMRLSIREEMISFDPYENFDINRILMLTVGVWPYQRSKLVQFQLILISVILTSSVVFQLTTFVTAECTPTFVITILSSTTFFFTYVVQYNCIWAKGQTLKYVLEQLRLVCKELKDENEIAVIKKYGSNARYYTVVLTWLTASIMCIVFILPIWPHIVNTILSANESRTRRTIYIRTEYFVDPDKYYYLILLHMNASWCIGSIVTVATGTIFISHLQHTCAMFRIASYRIEQALSNILREIGPKEEIKIHKHIIYAVNIHRKAIKYSEIIISNFENMFILLLILSVSSLSLNLFRVSQILSFGGNIEELLLHAFYVFVNFICLFIASYIAQDVSDHNDYVFTTTYNVQWYVTPLQIQKMILFLLVKGNKAYQLNIGGIIIISLSNFVSIVNTSLSYFAVIYSTQQ